MVCNKQRYKYVTNQQRNMRKEKEAKKQSI